MRKTVLHFTLFLMYLTLPLMATAQVVDIPDPNLRAAIKSALGISPRLPILAEQMSHLTFLEARDGGTSNLTGLEYATNLETLQLGGNNISDISLVSGLTNLTWLELNGNTISDISAVSGLTNLTWLKLNGNNISDVTAVSGLTNLTWLELNGNTISDISAVSGLTNLTWLKLNGNNISDITAVSGLTNLTLLYLGGNTISDISAVSGLTNLTRLELNGNTISDISPVAGLTNLILLVLRGNSIEDLSPLVANTGLGEGDGIGVDRNPLNSVSIDTHIPALESRGVVVSAENLITPQVVDIPDANLRTAIESALGIAPGGTITAEAMATLTTLEARDGGISNLTGLEYATNLTVLGLDDNNISDITAVTGLTNLTLLVLRGNSIEDLSPLVANTGLGSADSVIVDRNPLNSESIDTHIPVLRSRGVEVSAENLITPQVVNIPDPNLRTAIESALGIAPGGTITAEAMATLTTLEARNGGISNLTGLKYAINLTNLNLSGNNISDISAVAGLTDLTELYLAGNPLNYASLYTHIPAASPSAWIRVLLFPSELCLPLHSHPSDAGERS